MDKVHQQREVADKMEKLEHQAAINDSINESVKKEEQRVIEAANRRMAEVHAKKAEEANQAFQAIEAQQRAQSFRGGGKEEGVGCNSQSQGHSLRQRCCLSGHAIIHSR